MTNSKVLTSELGSEPSRANRVPLGSKMTELSLLNPTAPVITFGSRTIVREELETSANRLARAFQEMGVTHGDMVTIALPNSPGFYETCLAVWKLGAIPQPVSARLPLRERQEIVELADSRLVVGADDGEHGQRRCIPCGYTPDRSLDTAPLPPVVSPSWKAPTSGGSTGRPKIIVSTQPGVAGKQITKVLGIAATDCQLVAGPLYHSGPFIFSMLGLFEGNHLIVLPRFDALQALDAIDTYCVSLMMVVPTMMSRMLSVLEESGDRHHLRSMRRLWHMSAPCPQWLKRKWIEILGPERIFELYGGTEAQSTTIIDGVEWLQHPGSVGRQALGEMIVLDEQGAEAPRGEVGEIFMRPTDNRSTYRYVGAEPRRLEGWESIGDLGWMDQDGYLYIADRRKDLILRGGANIYPAEVEGALSEHRSVGSCAVVGVSDDDLGQRVHAIVHLVAPADEGELLAHLQERLVRYKVPETWEFVDSPVRDEAGKVRRSALALRTARRNSRRSTRCDAES